VCGNRNKEIVADEALVEAEYEFSGLLNEVDFFNLAKSYVECAYLMHWMGSSASPPGG